MRSGGADIVSADEPLLLLPGTLCDRRVWEPVLALLPECCVIVPVMVPEGMTPDLAARIFADAPQRFALAGFSLGGIVALEMMAQEPGRVTRLALIDTTARPDPPANQVARREAVSLARSMGMERFVRERVWPTAVGAGRLADASLLALLIAMAVELGVEALGTQSEVAIHRDDSRPRLGAVAVPTLVLCGEEDGACPVDRHREIAAGVTGAELVVVPGCGHFALIERPDLVAEAMRRWLAVGNDEIAGAA